MKNLIVAFTAVAALTAVAPARAAIDLNAIDLNAIDLNAIDLNAISANDLTARNRMNGTNLSLENIILPDGTAAAAQ